MSLVNSQSTRRAKKTPWSIGHHRDKILGQKSPKRKRNIVNMRARFLAKKKKKQEKQIHVTFYIRILFF